MRYRLISGALAAVLVSAGLSAHAQDNTIAVGGLWEVFVGIIVPILGTVAALIVGWLASLASRLFGLNIEAKHREALQTAITNAAGLALQKVGPRVKGVTITVGSPAVAAAANYVIDSVPDALRYFGIMPKRPDVLAADHAKQIIAEKVVAKIGVLNATTPASTSSPPVTAEGESGRP